MRNLRDIRGSLPSASLVLHYALICFALMSMGAGTVYYSHVEKAMASVEGSAKQVSGLADRLRVDLPTSPESDAKLVRIQAKADQIQTVVQSVVPKSTTVN